MADISAIASAIATRVATISTLTNRASAFGKDFVDPPWAIVVPAPGDLWRETSFGGGSYDLTFLIKVLEKAADDRASQDRLTNYMDASGSSSIKAAVDGTLGATVAFATVIGPQNYGDVEWGGAQFYGVEFVVEVGT